MFIGLIAVNVIPQIKDQLPAGWLPIINIVLPILGIYFRAKPKQKFDVGDVLGQVLKQK